MILMVHMFPLITKSYAMHLSKLLYWDTSCHLSSDRSRGYIHEYPTSCGGKEGCLWSCKSFHHFWQYAWTTCQQNYDVVIEIEMMKYWHENKCPTINNWILKSKFKAIFYEKLLNNYPDHAKIWVSLHLPLKQPLGVHELTVALPHAAHHAHQHDQHHALLVHMLLAWSFLKCSFQRICYILGR